MLSFHCSCCSLWTSVTKSTENELSYWTQVSNVTMSIQNSAVVCNSLNVSTDGQYLASLWAHSQLSQPKVLLKSPLTSVCLSLNTSLKSESHQMYLQLLFIITPVAISLTFHGMNCLFLNLVIETLEMTRILWQLPHQPDDAL